jgi:RNA polymerase primary sigma factor
MSRIWSHYASITADRQSKHGISRVLIPDVRVVCSYLNNLEQGQTEAAHAIRELISKPLSSMIAILNKQGVEEGGRPRNALNALSRSPIVIRQILAIGEDLKRGVRSIKEIVVFDEEEITEEILQNRVKDITRRIDELRKHYKRASQLAGWLPTIPVKEKAREYRRCRCSRDRGPDARSC